jgi:hypothetical protein
MPLQVAIGEGDVAHRLACASSSTKASRFNPQRLSRKNQAPLVTSLTTLTYRSVVLRQHATIELQLLLKQGERFLVLGQLAVSLRNNAHRRTCTLS